MELSAKLTAKYFPYFSFTYFYGKAYFGLAENVCDRV